MSDEDLDDQTLDERDKAQDALQDTHIALGGDGEWVFKFSGESPPDSGDLHLDVPALAEERMEQIADLTRQRNALAAACKGAQDVLYQCINGDVNPDSPRDLDMLTAAHRAVLAALSLCPPMENKP